MQLAMLLLANFSSQGALIKGPRRKHREAWRKWAGGRGGGGNLLKLTEKVTKGL